MTRPHPEEFSRRRRNSRVRRSTNDLEKQFPESHGPSLRRLQEFDSVPERIGHVHPIEPFERFICRGHIAGGSAPIGHVGKTSDQKRRMRFLRRAKVGVNAKVQPQGSSAEPHAAARGEIGRLRLFDETENACIERPGLDS